MDGRTAIESVQGPVREIANACARLGQEATKISEQWVQLGRVGGQRDDHAAQLLARLRHELRGIQRRASEMLECIDEVKANPFGDKETEK